jgi:L-alanine-DL-glutamate epimerase-like enolase superfamily enzyme
MSGPVVTTYERVAELPLTIDGYALEARERQISPEFERLTTTFHLRGAGEEGLGEDVTYSPDDQRAQQARGPDLPLAGAWTFASFCEHVGGLDLFAGGEPGMSAFRYYRRWAIESAALDLALRQAGQSLAQALDREESPIHFVASLRIGNPPSFDPVGRRLEVYPWLQFKLDGTPDWDQDLIDRLAATGAIASIDFKGAYKGTPVDVDTDPAFYKRIAETLPNAWLEDPDLTDPEADAVLEPHRHRITWDAPIHSVADIENLAFAPRTINVKPSRFGSTEELFAAYDYCTERGIEIYGGGQAELGVGRGQIQYLASIFHPDGVNDIAPAGYDWAEFPTGLPASPLAPDHEPTGFRRRT